MRPLDRTGIFKVRPIAWKVKTFKESQSIAISIDFSVVAQLDEANEWVDWAQYDEHRATGDYFVVKKDGSANVGTVKQLSESLGWNGSLRAVSSTPPPSVVVQVQVKEESYNGKTTFKAGWMNPENFVPTSGGAGDAEVGQLEARFGSLLRAAAASAPKPVAAKPATAAKPAAPPRPAAAPKPAVQTEIAPSSRDAQPYGDPNVPF